MSKPPVLALQLDRCDVCGKKIHRRELVRTQVEFLAAEAQNYFPYSSYNTGLWSISEGTSDGTISIGPYADRSRVRISDDNTSTEIDGSQTFTVGAAVGSYSGFLRLRSDQYSIDMSAWTSLVVSFDFGFYQQEQNTDANVYMYMLDENGVSAGITKKYMRTSGGIRYWDHVDISEISSSCDLTAMQFYVAAGTYSGDEQVWLDRFQLEKNVSKLGTFVPTSGTSVDRNDTTMMTMRKVCPNCRERILSKSERYGKIAEIRTDQPVAVDNQEF